MHPFEAYRCCRLCPRDCKVDRTQGAKGVCGETSTLRIAHLGAHFGEEPSFSGTRGSGTIFFSGCSSHCFFCQNYQISGQHEGKEYAPGSLLKAVKGLLQKEEVRPVPTAQSPREDKNNKGSHFSQKKSTKTEDVEPYYGVHNLNFVTPDHFWPHIRELCRTLREERITVPMLFNCSGYQKAKLVGEYGACMDIFMPDFKFGHPELAKTCMGDERYPGIALEAIREMVRLKGLLEPWDPTGEEPARKGVLIRHLVLPGHVENSLEVLRLIHKEFGPGIPLSVMSQYRPVPECSGRGEFQRTLKAKEYEQVLGLAGELGFSRVYAQELVEQTAFLPDFNDPEDPFPGHRPRKR